MSDSKVPGVLHHAPNTPEFTASLLHALQEIERRRDAKDAEPVTYNGEPIKGWAAVVRIGATGLGVTRNFSDKDVAHAVTAMIRSLKERSSDYDFSILALYMLQELAPLLPDKEAKP